MSAAADPRIEMLSDLAGCAYRIGMAFGRAAEAASGPGELLKWVEPFQACFFAVRVSIALQLRLEREARREGRGRFEDLRESEPPGREAPEREAPDRDDDEREETEREERLDYTERDRDRETERASFPILLRALDGVVACAADLPGPPPAELPRLRDLLAHAKGLSPGPPPGQPPVRPRPAVAGPQAAAPIPQSHGRPASNVGEVLAARGRPRRATGPPRR